MSKTQILFVPVLLLAGCIHPSPAQVSPAANAAAAARARYRAIQYAQKPAPAARRFEKLPLLRPAHTEDGILRAASTEYLRLPLAP